MSSAFSDFDTVGHHEEHLACKNVMMFWRHYLFKAR